MLSLFSKAKIEVTNKKYVLLTDEVYTILRGPARSSYRRVGKMFLVKSLV